MPEISIDRVREVAPLGMSQLDDRFADKPCPRCEDGYRYMGSDECCPVCNDTKRVPITEAERWHVKQPGDVTDFTVARYLSPDQIKAAIEEPCGACGGEGEICAKCVTGMTTHRSEHETDPCPACNGTGSAHPELLELVRGRS